MSSLYEACQYQRLTYLIYLTALVCRQLRSWEFNCAPYRAHEWLVKYPVHGVRFDVGFHRKSSRHVFEIGQFFSDTRHYAS